MYTENWLKLHRKIFDNEIWMQPVELRLFIYLIGQARYKEEPNTKYKSKGVIIERGQYLRSYRKLQEDLQYFENNTIKQYPLVKIKRAIDKLKNQERIKTEKTQLGTLFTICNYCQYQGSDKNNREHGTELEQGWNGVGTELEQYSKKGKKVKKGKNNNIVPKTEIKKIYSSLSNYWKDMFKDYIDIYKSKNKTGKITTNKHYRLLNELYQILNNLKFDFDKQEYEMTEDIFEHGLNQIIEKNIDNLNYAKKVWISEIENKEDDNVEQISGINRTEEEGRTGPEEAIFNS